MTDILSQTDPDIELMVHQIEPTSSRPPPPAPPSANFVTPTNTSDGHSCDPCAGPNVCPGQECAGSDQQLIMMLLVGAVVAVRIPSAFVGGIDSRASLHSGSTTCE
jgi:hypothetical protein|eukprot:COSAG02_NODE_480_length_21469_cov_13.479551_11_plen_106_part_00